MFTVPVIPPDLRHEETIIQAAYALDCLQETINSVFGHIDKRIEKNNDKVLELQQRIKKSLEKIKNLQGTRKAIHIYAPARFPSSHIFKEIPVTFKDDVKHLPFKNLTGTHKVQSKVEASLPNINEKLVFFHVREGKWPVLENTNSFARERQSIKQTQHLGAMPNELRSVSSVLLFNTEYSPYSLEEVDGENGVCQTENWKRAKLFKSKRKTTSNSQISTPKQILEPAPHSLAHRNEKLTPSGGLRYTPKLSEAPELNLPLDLPDLPGIADDLRYESQEAKQKIAPSLEMVVDSLPDLKDLLEHCPNTDNNANEKINVDRNSNATSSKTMETPPPPPPPPPTVPLSTPTPPPPPPPPTILEQKQLPKSMLDSRSELMAAIRNVDKSHLKRTAAAPLDNNSSGDIVDARKELSQQGKAVSHSGGDLMADLHNKLLMRRKGISGTKDNAEIPSGNPVISRLSSLIPPPPPAKLKTTSEDDEDSNDTDWVD